jgi:hypothetical protein
MSDERAHDGASRPEPRPEPRTVLRSGLRYWLPELVQAADLDPQGGGTRLRVIAGARRARIGLDDDAVDVWFRDGHLSVAPPSTTDPVDGVGSTTSAVVLELLAGRLEVSDAFARGEIQATGNRDSISRIFLIIEILLDASARVPRFRELADEFRTSRAPAPAATPAGTRESRRSDGRIGDAERTLLSRLGLVGPSR